MYKFNLVELTAKKIILKWRGQRQKKRVYYIPTPKLAFFFFSRGKSNAFWKSNKKLSVKHAAIKKSCPKNNERIAGKDLSNLPENILWSLLLCDHLVMGLRKLDRVNVCRTIKIGKCKYSIIHFELIGWWVICWLWQDPVIWGQLTQARLPLYWTVNRSCVAVMDSCKPYWRTQTIKFLSFKYWVLSMQTFLTIRDTKRLPCCNLFLIYMQNLRYFFPWLPLLCHDHNIGKRYLVALKIL